MNLPKERPNKWIRVLIPGVLIVIWLIVAGVGGQYFPKISEQSSTDLTTFLPESADATKVNNELKKYRDKQTIPMLVVFSNDGKDLTQSDLDAIKDVNDDLAKVEGVTGSLSPPVQSEDKEAAFVAVPLASDADFKAAFPEIKEQLTSAKLPVDYVLTGPASFAHDLQVAFGGIDGTLLIVALAVVFVILLVVYRSPFLPFIVLFSAMTALSGAIFVVYQLAQADIVQLNGQVQGILFILVIGAATDYSLLYIARYREEMINHLHSWHAMWAALKSSWEPIVAAGGTVIVGLMCLLISDLGSNKALGPAAGIGILFSIVTSLTLLPALLVACGRRVFWPRQPQYEEVQEHHDYKRNHPIWAKVGALVQRHPRRIWAGSMVLLLIACAGIFQLKAVGVPQSELIVGNSEARDGQKVLDAHFPSGSGTPAFVLTDQAKQDEIVKTLEADEGVSSVSVMATGVESGAIPVGKAEAELRKKILDGVTEARDKQVAEAKAQIAKQTAGLPPAMASAAASQVVSRVPSAEKLAEEAYPFKAGKAKVVDGNVFLQVTLRDSASSFEARETIVRLRDEVKKVDSGALVGGTTAAQYDTNQAAIRDEIVIIPVILIAITIILMMLLRAIIAPLILLLTIVISFCATLGISAILFNHVWHFPGADPSVILFGFVFLVALGIDYNIFLMSRVREETGKWGVRAGTIKGLVVTGGVITSAGIVLAATFASLSVIPILFLSQIAFIVAFGVLLDTIVVRSLLVPALTLEIGRLMWWPSKLWRGKK